MAVLVAAAAWISAVALGSVGVEADARLSAGGRAVRLSGQAERSEAVVELAPRLALLRPGRLRLDLSYAPRLTLPAQIESGASGQTAGTWERRELLNVGAAALEYAATPNLSMRLAADATFGRLDLLRSSIYATDVITATRSSSIAYRALSASAGMTATPTVRTTAAASIRAFEEGGADEEARQVAGVPLRRGAGAEARLGYAVTRRDEVTALGDVVVSDFTPTATPAPQVARSAYARLGARWDRRLAPALSGRLASGAAWAYEVERPPRTAQSFGAWAEAGVVHDRERPALRTELGLALSPYLSPLSGNVDQRLDASVATTWRAARAWAVVGRASGSQIRGESSLGRFWTGTSRSELATADVRASWRFARDGALSFGPAARWQRGHDPQTPSFVEWGGWVTLLLGARWPEPGDALPPEIPLPAR